KIERHSAAARDEFLRYLLRTQNSRLLELTAAAADELGDSTLLDQLLHHAMSGGKVPSVSIPLVPGSAS
ncbi:MAG: hypothetical protein ACJ73D_07070, partial [Pyrinomonadaceae bacterium]